MQKIKKINNMDTAQENTIKITNTLDSQVLSIPIWVNARITAKRAYQVPEVIECEITIEDDFQTGLSKIIDHNALILWDKVHCAKDIKDIINFRYLPEWDKITHEILCLYNQIRTLQKYHNGPSNLVDMILSETREFLDKEAF